jgi:hypothetical protein
VARKCYAAALGGCASKLTNEHYISDAIIKVMERLGPMKVSGVPWSPEPKIIPSNGLTARILCKTHNEQLSALDSEALRLFEWLEPIAVPGAPLSDRIDLDGHLFERWLLKVLCGMLASKSLQFSDAPVQGTPGLDWLEVLYGLAPMRPRCGLYQWAERDERDYQHGISVKCVYRMSQQALALMGAVFTIHGVRWLLAMQDPAGWGEESAGWRTYRPNGLRFHGEDGLRGALHLNWNSNLQR